MSANPTSTPREQQPGVLPHAEATATAPTEPPPPTATTATLASLPTELLLRIFTLSSNPALALLSRDFYTRIGDASKTSVATRVAFLMVRYRAHWGKMIVKGLRWKFFNRDVLHALDRLYAREVQSKHDRRVARRQRKELRKQIEAQLDPRWSSMAEAAAGASSNASTDKSLKRKAVSSSSSSSTLGLSIAAVSSPSDLAQESDKEDEDEESRERKRLRTVGGETYWRSMTSSTSASVTPLSRSASSSYDFFSTNNNVDIIPSSASTSSSLSLPPLVPSPLRSIYSYPALASRPSSETASRSSRGSTPQEGAANDGEEGQGNTKDDPQDRREPPLPTRIPLVPGFQIPRRLFRGGANSSSSTSSDNNNNINSDDNGNSNIALVCELLQRGASATAPANYPMIRSAQRGDLAMIRTLVRYGGAVPDQVALRWACVEGHVAVVDYFLVGGGYETEEIQVAEMVEDAYEEGDEQERRRRNQAGNEKEKEETGRRKPRESKVKEELKTNQTPTTRRLRSGLVPNSECLQACLERGNSAMVDRLLKSGAVPDMKTLMML
ncbi:hypothetical protein BGZ73_003701 [Actinomortierella ambigua]|nr:hypothetical protein BGZ73_003701 [Actinomortierella ambigua]